MFEHIGRTLQNGIFLEQDRDSLVDGTSDMSNNEILYDRDGNVVGEDDVAKGLKEIMEYHMNKLKKSLVIMGVLAKTEDKE